MPRRNANPPTYGLHKTTGQARVVFKGKSYYLGRYGSSESREKYARLVAEWESGRKSLPLFSRTTEGDVTVVELIARYWPHVEAYYVKNGQRTDEQETIRQALRHVSLLYGMAPAAEFGPLALKAVRQSMIDAGWCRSHINKQVGRVKRLFKWGVENELVPPSLYHGLQAVAGLRKGRCGVRESEPVKPVSEAHINAIHSHVSRQVWAMIELQQLTGMRPGEAVIMRACDTAQPASADDARLPQLLCRLPADHHILNHILPLSTNRASQLLARLPRQTAESGSLTLWTISLLSLPSDPTVGR